MSTTSVSALRRIVSLGNPVRQVLSTRFQSAYSFCTAATPSRPEEGGEESEALQRRQRKFRRQAFESTPTEYEIVHSISAASSEVIYSNTIKGIDKDPEKVKNLVKNLQDTALNFNLTIPEVLGVAKLAELEEQFSQEDLEKYQTEEMRNAEPCGVFPKTKDSTGEELMANRKEYMLVRPGADAQEIELYSKALGRSVVVKGQSAEESLHVLADSAKPTDAPNFVDAGGAIPSERQPVNKTTGNRRFKLVFAHVGGEGPGATNQKEPSRPILVRETDGSARGPSMSERRRLEQKFSPQYRP